MSDLNYAACFDSYGGVNSKVNVDDKSYGGAIKIGFGLSSESSLKGSQIGFDFGSVSTAFSGGLSIGNDFSTYSYSCSASISYEYENEGIDTSDNRTIESIKHVQYATNSIVYSAKDILLISNCTSENEKAVKKDVGLDDESSSLITQIVATGGGLVGALGCNLPFLWLTKEKGRDTVLKSSLSAIGTSVAGIALAKGITAIFAHKFSKNSKIDIVSEESKNDIIFKSQETTIALAEAGELLDEDNAYIKITNEPSIGITVNAPKEINLSIQNTNIITISENKITAPSFILDNDGINILDDCLKLNKNSIEIMKKITIEEIKLLLEKIK